jgi:hypothetical protein
MMKKILFFDTTWNQILRFGNLISKDIKEVTDARTYGLVYETSGKKFDPSKDAHSFDDYLVTTKISAVEDYINKIKPEIVVFAQNTTPDLGAIFFSQKVGAKIVMMQHGLLYDGASLNNVRLGEIFAALMMAKKTLDYLNIMRVLCKKEGKSFVKLVNTIIKEKENVTTTVQNYFNPPLRGDSAFVIGSHWVDYYHDNYGYPKENIYIMGNHDVDDLEEGKELEDAICYIPSVHVEDGKVQLSVFNEYLENLKTAIPEGTKIYIKLHPRSNKKIYTDILGEENIEYVTSKDLPYVKTYIGHNSSLLSKALQISGKLILWGFKEEKDLFYKDFAFAVCHDGDSLKKAVKDALSGEEIEGRKDITAYSYKNPIGAFRYCSNKIVELYK